MDIAGKSKTVGKMIKRKREGRKWSQKDLADKLRYNSPNFITMLERGNATFPLEHWEKFAEALEISKEYFLRCVLLEKYPSMKGYLGKIEETGPELELLEGNSNNNYLNINKKKDEILNELMTEFKKRLEEEGMVIKK